jgi:hypothetical protein
MGWETRKWVRMWPTRLIGMLNPVQYACGQERTQNVFFGGGGGLTLGAIYVRF